MKTKTVTVSEFMAKHEIDWTSTNEGRIQSPWDDKPREVDHYKFFFKRGVKKMSVNYYCGTACARPQADDVMDTLRSDFETVIDSNWETVKFEDWAPELGYDVDSRKAEKTYKAGLHQSNRLFRFLANDGAAVMARAVISELMNTERL